MRPLQPRDRFATPWRRTWETGMNRRWSESVWPAAEVPAPPAGKALPGFVACSLSTVPFATATLWQSIYQAAFAQAIAQLIGDSQPTKYQRLVYRVSLN